MQIRFRNGRYTLRSNSEGGINGVIDKKECEETMLWIYLKN